MSPDCHCLLLQCFIPSLFSYLALLILEDHPLASLASLGRARLSSIHERFLISPVICSGAKIQAGLGGNSEKVIRSHRDVSSRHTTKKCRDAGKQQKTPDSQLLAPAAPSKEAGCTGRGGEGEVTRVTGSDSPEKGRTTDWGS